MSAAALIVHIVLVTAASSVSVAHQTMDIALPEVPSIIDALDSAHYPPLVARPVTSDPMPHV